MEHKNILEDLAQQTNGEIYIGVVGPVRTGKSTLIKRLMETMILPRMEDEQERRRAEDELPQSGAGKNVMTTEPKFVPAEAVTLKTRGKQNLKVRLVDCVGYTVEGAGGFSDGDGERMVHTAWQKAPMPFSEAAELGTRKVIEDHSTLGLVVTTDGSICDLPRAAYETAERRVIEELQALNKPFLVLMNTKTPDSPGTRALCEDLRQRTGARVIPMDLKDLDENDAMTVLEEALKEFPLRLLRVWWPAWVEQLPGDHWFPAYLQEKLTAALSEADRVHRLEEAGEALRSHRRR